MADLHHEAESNPSRDQRETPDSGHDTDLSQREPLIKRDSGASQNGPANQLTRKPTREEPNLPSSTSTYVALPKPQSEGNPPEGRLEVLSAKPKPATDDEKVDGIPSTLKRMSSDYSTHLKEILSLPFSPDSHYDRPDIARKSHDDSTARLYSYKRQRYRLWRLAVFECFLTFVFCGTYAGIISSFAKLETIDRAQRHWFNALVTMNALALGINLTNSMKSYAKLLRWLLLAQSWRSLRSFDLIMSCDNIVNCFKLMFTPKDRKRPFRPCRTQLLAFLWILANLALALLVGMIGLNYSLDISGSLRLLEEGSTSMANLTAVGDPAALNTDWYWTIQRQADINYNAENTTDFSYDGGTGFNYQTLSNGTTRHFLRSADPQDPEITSVSRVFIQSNAVCTAHEVVEGKDAGQPWFTWKMDNGTVANYTFPGRYIPARAGLLAGSNENSTCGERCTNIMIFIPRSTNKTDVETPEGHRPPNFSGVFFCNNTVDPLRFQDLDSVIDIPLGSDYYFQIDPLVSRILAGTIGWTGFGDSLTVNNTWQYQAYDALTVESNTGNYYEGAPSAVNMSDYVSSFTMKAVVGLDSGRLAPVNQFNVTGGSPRPAQILDVTWKYVIALLVSLAGGHLLTLGIVFIQANKAIIKDDSPLAIAKLYYSLLKHNGLGDRGCMLKGDEIIDYMGDPTVGYGWVPGGRMEGGSDSIAHVDIFMKDHEPTGSMKIRGGWGHKFKKDILYDGIGGDNVRKRSPAQQIPEKRYRDFDASEYF